MECVCPEQTHLVSEFDAVELVGRLEQLGPEGGGDELGVTGQLHDHVWNTQTAMIKILNILNTNLSFG